jgi:hypothetical protein
MAPTRISVTGIISVMYNLMAFPDGRLRNAMLLELHDVTMPLGVKVSSGRVLRAE